MIKPCNLENENEKEITEMYLLYLTVFNIGSRRLRNMLEREGFQITIKSKSGHHRICSAPLNGRRIFFCHTLQCVCMCFYAIQSALNAIQGC